jgi:polygalacturonase
MNGATSFFCGTLFLCLAASAAGNVVDVRDLGGLPDGKSLATEKIQAAIDRCAAGGGGTVYLAPGTWLSGTIFMKDRVRLQLEAGCTLLGSGDLKDYPQHVPRLRSFTDRYVNRSLIAGEDLREIAICGQGTIDGNGGKFPETGNLIRPFLIRLVNCRDVCVENIHLRNSAMWLQLYLGCERVRIRGISVFNHVRVNNDGIDIDSCRDATISDCTIDCIDDAICLKSTCGRSCENVAVTNCTLRSYCTALKTGTESNGGFKNVTVSNCTIQSPRGESPVYVKAGRVGIDRGQGGIALLIADGGTLDRVAISNIAIDGVLVPIYLRLGDRNRPFQSGTIRPTTGSFRNVVLSNIVATGASKVGCAITSVPGHRIENVSLNNVRIVFEGGGAAEDAARSVPEVVKPHSYRPQSFGTLPAFGFYCRHAKGISFRNVSLSTETPDARPACVAEDVEHFTIDGLDAPSGARALIRLN